MSARQMDQRLCGDMLVMDLAPDTKFLLEERRRTIGPAHGVEQHPEGVVRFGERVAFVVDLEIGERALE